MRIAASCASMESSMALVSSAISPVDLIWRMAPMAGAASFSESFGAVLVSHSEDSRAWGYPVSSLCGTSV